MEFSTPTLASCSREHQQIYQDWFAYADSGFDFIWLSFLFTLFFSLRSYLSLQMGTGGSPDRMLSTSSPCPIYHGPNLNRFFFLPFPFPLPFCHVASSILTVMPMLILKQKTKKKKKIIKLLLLIWFNAAMLFIFPQVLPFYLWSRFGVLLILRDKDISVSTNLLLQCRYLRLCFRFHIPCFCYS